MTFGDLIISLHLDNLHFFPLMAQIDYEANHSATVLRLDFPLVSCPLMSRLQLVIHLGVKGIGEKGEIHPFIS